MAWSTRGSRGGASCRAIAGLTLVMAGCEANPNDDPAGTGAQTGRIVVASHEEIGLRFGLSDRMAYLGLADSLATTPKTPSPFRFTDILEGSGVDFVHVSGTTADRYFPTAFGSGVAMVDYDGDGRLDLYFATCTFLPLGTAEAGPNKLYKNLGGGMFEDVTAEAGLDFRGFCHGIIAGDVDNDGDQDLFLCNVGPNALFLNEGDGTFRDVSRDAGIDAPAWSMGGVMLDYDGDGDLDLFVANYGDYEFLRTPRPCGSDRIPIYCQPGGVPTARHMLYRNDGEGTFTDVTDEAGLGRDDGRGFGAVAADLNGDVLVDLYVVNDLRPNFLFLNRGDGTFEDATETSGAGLDATGGPQASMGVDAEDCDGDGLPELLASNFQYEYTALYRNLTDSTSATADRGGVPPAGFHDSSAEVGLVDDSRPYVGWGCALADFDNDGWPDCFVANGHIDSNRNELSPVLSYLQPPMLHRNVPVGDSGAIAPGVGRRFQLATLGVGPYFASRHAGRGAAFGDLDDDGDIDIVVNHRDGAPAILRNDTPGNHAWIRLELVGDRSNRDAIGARVEVEAGGRTITRQRKSGSSMCSSNDPRLLVGLGSVEEVARLRIRWPSGTVSTLEQLATNTTYEVFEPDNEEGEVAAVAMP
ncbi:CRTAC1 family protein [Tautonia plasticadhaerens]|uniref:ASPIC and UnbV n=1 Tax=Tautonia plasticadhaerens TaxID=2527974 RepID=A0A518HA80_9BACT|nr:CRTAC1 family protein [Tautonia plasticadhaerens]QDV37758.1 ASPIC and UnbV [Tautonia plasticadhaerens]